ncbi:MAG: PQQ-binding-like beta-propeller repeat protein [Planctomycetota bacterium]|nr:PQQ-binding-like beta-propeller repeat protein [Planctomycetota bacterium]
MRLTAQFIFCMILALLANMMQVNFGYGQDWPMWRCDASRSASSDNRLAASLEPMWSLHHSQRQQAWDDPLNLDLMTYDRIFEPVIIKGMVIVPYNDESKVVAYRLKDGVKQWTFFTEGPVRLPAAGRDDKVCFCSDDGYLYCVDVMTGRLNWKFYGGPSQQHAIGNRRLVSAWPARGGPVVQGEHVYFSSSIWPFMGIFIYSLELETGAIHWVNDQAGSTYIKQPHSAPSFAGVAPQGAFAATQKHLIVPGGRSVPAVFDRDTGALKHFELNAGGKGVGGSFVAAEEERYFVHTRLDGTRSFSMSDGKKREFTVNRPVLGKSHVYSAEEAEDGSKRVSCYSKDNVRLWDVPCDGSGDLIQANQELIAAGGGLLTRISIPDEGKNPAIKQTVEIPLDTQRVLVADQTLLLVTKSGDILAYGSIRSSSQNDAIEQPIDSRSMTQTAVEQPQKDAGIKKLLLDLEEMDQNDGYCLWFGAAEHTGLKEFIHHSGYEQIIVVDPRQEIVNALRQWLDARGLHGRVTVHCSRVEDFLAPNYVASCVVYADSLAGNTSSESISTAYKSVRPYGGVLAIPTLLDGDPVLQDADLKQLEQVVILDKTYGLLLKKEGALPGSADWTHQYGDVANTIKSNDSRVKLPLGVLWFGGSSHMDVLPRHGHGPPAQVVGGRLFIQGIDCLSARDVYTGRVLWKKVFKDLGTFDVYYDSTFEDVPLNPKYNQVHIPGANGRGTNYVVTEDRIYIAAGDQCYVLDSTSGEKVLTIHLPNPKADDDEAVGESETPEWGYLGVYKDVLIGGLGFANYKDRMDLVYDGDKKLSRSKAGFGGKSIDRAASRALVGFNRYTGEKLWEIPSNYSFWHNGIVAGGEQIYCLDRYPIRVEQALMRRGISPPDSYRIAAFDYETGEPKWEVNEGIFGSWLSYSEEFDLLLQAGAAASDRLTDEVSKGMAVYRGGDGSVKWRKDDLRYTGPCILHHDWIITNTNSYKDSAGAFFLHDGRQKMVPNPVTGQPEPWHLTRAYGCNHIIASENMLTFRSGAAGYYDLLNDGGTGNFGGFKSGCTSNLVVANGVLNAPDYTRTCSCAYQNQTSLALVHMPQVDLWSVDDFASNHQLKEPIKHLGINFGAPGDRRDEQGQLWLEYPIIAGASPNIEVTWNDDVTVKQQHTSRVGDVDHPWVFASGLNGVQELSLTLEDLPKTGSENPIHQYQVTVYLSQLERTPNMTVEMSLQGQTKRIETHDTNRFTDGKYGRVTFSQVTLNSGLNFTVAGMAPGLCISGIEISHR